MDINKATLKEAAKSTCKKRKVGAIITDHTGKKILARGHNYLANISGGTTCEDTEGNTRPEVVHAEIAALNKLTNLDAAKYIYVTHQPCKKCQGAISLVGLEVVLVQQFMKFDSGKLRYSLIPPVATRELAKVLTYGAKKYKPNNWQEVDDTDRYVDALYRHLEAWRGGEEFDEESKLSHLSHALTNISFLLYFAESEGLLKK